ncbi:MAG: hypothetical protein LQ351_003251 [Letrouitia transgressa]|nr:MAG: hypothetical protein LQ351_003251 [Letrouitia transgressa]
MPPRLRNICTSLQWFQSASPFVSLFLLPFLYTQHRYASVLSNLSDNRSAYNKRIRRGRGPSSGKGKTSGRGHKGQKQHGKVPAGFNGGQTPDEVVHGIRGFTNVFSKDIVPLNLDKIQSWVDQGRLDPTKPITIKELAASRCASDIKDGIKLLAGGSERVSHSLNIIVSRASTAAIAAVEAAGGSVTTRYYTPSSIRGIIKGKIDPIHSLSSRIDVGDGTEERRVFENRLPDPTRRKEIEYYRDPAKRGYLSYQVGEGQGPSLFFRTPSTAKSVKKKVQSKITSGAENRMW